MDAALFFKALWSYKWLMLVGVIVAAVAALLAGFRVETGTLDPRADTQYRASTTVLLSNSESSIFQAEIPGQTIDPKVSAPQKRDLASAAIIYAYLISGNSIRKLVEKRVGALSDAESITALQRTTQPAGSETNPGRLNLPIIDVVGIALHPRRAAEISSAATAAFQEYAGAAQTASGIPQNARVQFTPLTSAKAEAVASSNPLIPVVAVFVGVLFAFTALTLTLFNVRMRRRERALASAGGSAETEPDDPVRPAPRTGGLTEPTLS